MVFCSECGLLLPPKATACPRCGITVTPVEESEGPNADDPTIISTPPNKTEPARTAPGPNPDAVQEPNQLTGYNGQTQRAEQGKDTSIPPSVQDTSTPPFAENMPSSTYYTQSPIPPPPPDHIARSDSQLAATQEAPYPGYVPGPVFPTGPGTPTLPIPSQRTKSKGTLLAMLLIPILVGITVGTIAIVFVIGPDRALQLVRGGGTTAQPTSIPPTYQASAPVPPTPQVPTPAPTTPTLTPEQQAQSVIDRYYAAINNKDYQTAYNLWVNNPDSYQDFTNGFADTKRDDHQFGQVLQQSDGTVQVYVTLVATSNSSQQTTYQGYYIVAKQSDGSWKITTASMSKA